MGKESSIKATKPVPLPGYVATRPLMPAVKRLWEGLGLQSSIIQTAEVALRYFESVGQQTKGGFDSFLTTQAAACGLAIGLKDFQEARRSSAKWFLVQAYQVCDSFLRRLIAEYQDYKRIDPSAWEYKVGQQT